MKDMILCAFRRQPAWARSTHVFEKIYNTAYTYKGNQDPPPYLYQHYISSGESFEKQLLVIADFEELDPTKLPVLVAIWTLNCERKQTWEDSAAKVRVHIQIGNDWGECCKNNKKLAKRATKVQAKLGRVSVVFVMVTTLYSS
jgi:hypothetical protein